mmetsp:Transcript_90914/g.252946  ORF Transcript_90914/g.252946 Transcript_90914/m.252946 type:complete len:112 (+) Transcript_90914:94-429(+)
MQAAQRAGGLTPALSMLLRMGPEDHGQQQRGGAEATLRSGGLLGTNCTNVRSSHIVQGLSSSQTSCSVDAAPGGPLDEDSHDTGGEAVDVGVSRQPEASTGPSSSQGCVLA